MQAALQVALDVTYALGREPSGVARYSGRLVRELARLSEADLVLCARWPRVLELRKRFADVKARRSWLRDSFPPAPIMHADVFHGLNQRLPRRGPKKNVVTVHDVFPLSSASYSTPEFRRRFTAIIRDAVERADRIICVSAYTRGELIRVLGVPRERCSVIHHGVDAPAAPSPEALAEARRLAGGGPFFLAVGAVQVRKNLQAAAEAVGRLPAPGARLLIAGGAGHGSAEFADFIRARGLAGRVILLGYTPQPLLDALYASAAALLFPSLEEGFGLPVLEAMARGLPVICSSGSSLAEVAGDAAVLLDPADVEGLSAGMSAAAARMLDDPAWRGEWRERGLARAASFTWRKAACATLDVYRSLC